MKATKWIWIWLVATVVSIAAIMAINYVADPLWCFGQNNSYSNIRIGFNERQQKTNYLFKTKDQYNTLLLGSSRTTYLAPEYFKKHKVFNYAANNMRPDEYLGYLNNFTEITGHAPETVILGLDFWGSSSTGKNEHKAPKYYLTQRNNWHYLLSSLASIDAIKYSLTNIKYELTGPPLNDAYYNNKLTKLEHGQTEYFKEQRDRTQLKHYTDDAYGKYKWDSTYTTTLKQLKEHYPDTKFLVFTTPVADTLLHIMFDQGRLQDYEKWLRTCVDVFGSVDHFMYPDSVYSNQNNYYDTQHFNAELAKIIAEKLEQNDRSATTELTATNIDSELQKFRKIFEGKFYLKQP